VCVKAKTNEGLGPVGKGEAIEAHAVVLLVPAGKSSMKKPSAKKPSAKKTTKRK